MSEGTIQSIK